MDATCLAHVSILSSVVDVTFFFSNETKFYHNYEGCAFYMCAHEALIQEIPVSYKSKVFLS